MAEKYIPLKLPAGLYQNGTNYEASRRWMRGNLIRFANGTIQPVGGWRRAQDDTGVDLAPVTGVARAAVSWRAGGGALLTAIGTTQKLYALAAGALRDITPLGFTTGRVDTGYATASGAYGSGVYGNGLYGVGSSASSLVEADTWQLDTFGDWLAAVCTSDHKLYVWQGDYAVLPKTPSGIVFTGSLVTSGATAGAATSIAITATTLTGTVFRGETLTILGVTYTATANASAASNIITVPVSPAVGGGGIAAATAVTYTSGAPTYASAVVVTPERFLVALGAGGDARKVQWPSQETVTDWVPSAVNTAGDYSLTTNGRLMAGRRTKSQTLLFTDDDLHSMTYIGGLLVYRFDQVARDCGLLAPNAVAVVDTQAFWMGRRSFFQYDGYVKELPSDVQDYVFGDFNHLQATKVVAVPNAEFGEVWWFYPSAGSTEIDRYVVYSYREGHWTTGFLARSAGAASGTLQYPILIAPSGEIYEHEILAERFHYGQVIGLADGSVTGDGSLIASGIYTAAISETPYLESGPLELEDGDRVVSINEIVPDEFTRGEVAMWLYSAMYPNGPETTHGPFLAGLPTSVRITGRQVRLRLEEQARTPWRVGTYRLAVIPGGRR